MPGAVKLVEECVRLGRANCEDRLARLRAKLLNTPNVYNTKRAGGGGEVYLSARA